MEKVGLVEMAGKLDGRACGEGTGKYMVDIMFEVRMRVDLMVGISFNAYVHKRAEEVEKMVGSSDHVIVEMMAEVALVGDDKVLSWSF